MDFSTPWSPTLHGVPLGPCALIEGLIKNRDTPSSRRPDEASWTPGAIESELTAAGEGRGAIEESVLALWRLKLEEGQGRSDGDWKSHLLAWLVRDLGADLTLGTNDLLLSEDIVITLRSLV